MAETQKRNAIRVNAHLILIVIKSAVVMVASRFKSAWFFPFVKWSFAFITSDTTVSVIIVVRTPRIVMLIARKSSTITMIVGMMDLMRAFEIAIFQRCITTAFIAIVSAKTVITRFGSITTPSAAFAFTTVIIFTAPVAHLTLLTLNKITVAFQNIIRNVCF